MKIIEMTGKTVENAIENGLLELGVKREMVDVEIINQGSKGLFGLIKVKPAKVKLTLKNDYEALAENFLRDVLKSMSIEAEINIVDENNVLKVNLVGSDMGILIGYRGETLDALQYLLSLVINKNNRDQEYKKVVLDTENYRKKREETLIKLASKLAYKTKKYSKSISLEPMNPYERRIIHAALQNNPYVKTKSEGDEPFRRVVIELK